MKKLLRTAFFVAAICGVFGVADAQAEPPAFGALSLRDLAGEKTTLADLRGKVVVLNFWATWCQPCVAEFPHLAKIAERFHDRGVIVVAASVDDAGSRQAVQGFADRLPEGMDIWVGATMEDMHRLGLGASVPVTVLLDRDGKLMHVEHGGIGADTLDKKIEAVLGAGGEHKGLPGIEQAATPGASVAAAAAPSPALTTSSLYRARMVRGG